LLPRAISRSQAAVPDGGWSGWTGVTKVAVLSL
jgi:hypothetical protein